MQTKKKKGNSSAMHWCTKTHGVMVKHTATEQLQRVFMVNFL